MYVVYHIREDFGRGKLALACLLWYNLSRETVYREVGRAKGKDMIDALAFGF